MLSQAVAFNMFLSFFPMMLIALALVSSLLGGKGGRELVERLTHILPPGTQNVVTDYFLRREARPWHWALIGWGGTLLGGSQVMKLIMEGVHLIYGDGERHSFFARQIRGLFLLCITLAPWLVAVGLSVFGRPLRQWMIHEFGRSVFVRGLWNILFPAAAILLAMLVLTVIYRVSRPHTPDWRDVLPGAALATVLWWSVNSLFGIYVRKMHYGLVYGGLASAIGLMVWMQLSAVIVFFGAAWNAERAAPSRGSR